jgi:hypothetical protein
VKKLKDARQKTPEDVSGLEKKLEAAKVFISLLSLAALLIIFALCDRHSTMPLSHVSRSPGRSRKSRHWQRTQ